MKKVLFTLATFAMALAPTTTLAYQESVEVVEVDKDQNDILIALLAASATLITSLIVASNGDNQPVSP